MEVVVNETLKYNVSGSEEQLHNYTYCSAGFGQFWYGFEVVLLNLNLVLCVFGVFTNALNFVVYTRKGMRNSTNLLLSGIAVCDFIVMATYVPQYVAKLDYMRVEFPYYTAVAWILHEYFLAVFHNISIWITVTLALWRYIAVIHPLKSKSLLTKTRARIIVAVIVVLNLLITIPGYVDAYIGEEDETKTWTDGGCSAKYCAKWKPINFLRKIEFWYQGLSKVFPAIFLTFVTIRLITALVRANMTRMKMMGSETRSPGRKGTNESESSREFERTTRMLVVVLVLFQITEVPPSVVYFLEIFFDKVFYFECRRPVHYLILMMYYLSGAFNFFVYVILSRNYRQALARVFKTQGFQERVSLQKGGESDSSNKSRTSQATVTSNV